MNRIASTIEPLNVMALVKTATNEKYIFLYADQHAPQILRTMGRFASDDELSFTWADAAVLSQKMRQSKH